MPGMWTSAQEGEKVQWVTQRARWMAREVGAGGSFLPNASVFLVL